MSREKVRHFPTTARFFSSKRRRVHFAAHGQWTRAWKFLMGINERGINETINETIDEAKCGACVSVCVRV